MPSHDGIGSDDRGYFPQSLPPQDLAFDSQAAPLIGAQEDAFLAELLHQSLDLYALKLDDGLLMPIYPTSKDDNQQMPRVQY